MHLPDGTGTLRFWPSLLPPAAQARLFRQLALGPGVSADDAPGKHTDDAEGGGAAGQWIRRPIKLFGKEILQPRLTCFFGRRGIAYRWGQWQMAAGSSALTLIPTYVLQKSCAVL